MRLWPNWALGRRKRSWPASFMVSRRSGPLRAFRIADMRHAIFDGSGAMLHGARWTSPGRRVIYAAETYAPSAAPSQRPERYTRTHEAKGGWMNRGLGPELSRSRRPRYCAPDMLLPLVQKEPVVCRSRCTKRG